MRVLWIVGLVGAASVVGCGKKDGGSTSGDGDGDGDQGANVTLSSGSRLKARQWSGGGLTWLESIRDTELDAPCWFSLDGNGKYYCLPSNEPGTAGVQVLFQDDGCTEPFGSGYDNSCDLGRYTTLYRGGVAECESGSTTTYEVGDSIEVPSVAYYLEYDGTCIETSPGSTAYSLVEVARDTLVEADVQVVNVTDELGVQMLETSDGFRMPYALHDLERDGACNYTSIGAGQMSEGGVEICLGSVAYSESEGNYGYSDDTCETPSAATSSCAEVEFAMSFEQVGECYTTRLFDLGQKLDLTDVYAQNDACEPIVDSNFGQYFELGDEADLSTLPPVEITHPSGSRLAPRTYSSRGEALYATPDAYDTELQIDCYPAVIAGKTYCLPSGTQAIGPGHDRFADDACTVPILSIYTSECWDITPDFIGTYEDQPACGGIEFDAVHEAETFDGDATYFATDTGCEELALEEGIVYFQLGEQVDPDELFAELSLED